MASAKPDQWAFLIDEDMPRSLAPALRAAGYAAEDGRDVGLGGKDDSIVFAYAQTHQQTLITEDMGFRACLKRGNKQSLFQVFRMV